MIYYDIKEIYYDIIENHDIIAAQGSRCGSEDSDVSIASDVRYIGM
jgi:hypothetical protein